MQPQSPNPDFDFMLKNQVPSKRGLHLPNLPKPVKIGLLVVVGLIVLIVISSLLSGRNKASSQAIVGALERNAETLRVTTLVQQQLQLQDPQTQSLAATVNASLTSDKAQLSSYLAQNHIKVSRSQLALDTDKTTDTNLQSAAQNNSLDSAYIAYLKTAIAKYQTDLLNAYNAAGPNGKKILASSFDSTKALLSSPPLKG